jgi:hypothetical protein
MDRTGARIFAAAIALLCGGVCRGEQPRCSAWELVNPRPQANHLRDVAFGGGRWVAVGEGIAVVSTDAVTWSAVPLPDRSLRGVAYGNGVFVAVGAGGAIVRSGDDAEWESIETPATADLEAVAFAGGTFLAVGADATVLASGDGLTWTQEWPGAVTGDLAGVRVSGRFAGNPAPMFLVWGPSTIALRRLDGIWLAIPLPEGAVVTEAVFWVNSAICATFRCPAGWCGVEQCGPTYFHVTHDGVTWEGLCYGLEQGPTDVVPNGKGLVGLQRYETQASSTLWITPDGWSWFQRQSAFNVPMHAIETGGGWFVAVGDCGAIWTSTDGETWASASGPTTSFDGVAWNGTAFAASATWIVSTPPYWYGLQRFTFGGDGRQWNPSATNLDLTAAGPGLFVATGGSMSYPGSNAFSSIDGVTWTQRSSLPSRPLVGGMWDGERFVILIGGWEVNCRVTCNPNPLFAAIGDGLSEWLAVEQPELGGQSALTGMAYNGVRYVAFGSVDRWQYDRGRILASEDGLSWRHVGDAPGLATGTQAVASDGGGFVAVRGTSVLTSPDGLAWSSVDIAPLHLIGVMWTGDEYLAVGDDGAGHAAIARSPGGSAWTYETFPAIPARLLAVTGGQRVQLAVGQAGVTLRRECHSQSPSRRLRGVR